MTLKVLLAPGPLRAESDGGSGTAPRLGAAEAGAALENGWSRSRPDDDLAVVPLPDGGTGSGTDLRAGAGARHLMMRTTSPLGQERSATLVETSPGDRHGVSTWFLDAGEAVGPALDPEERRQEAIEGSTVGLGSLLEATVETIGPRDSLVLGLPPSAVHDGGQGMVMALGGVARLREILGGHEVILALPEGVSLGGLSGAGYTLVTRAGVDPQVAQERDRRACATALSLAQGLWPLRGRPLLAGSTADTLPSVVSWGTGAAGGCALVLRAAGARAMPGARVMAGLVGITTAIQDRELLVTSAGELFDVPTDSVIDVLGAAAADRAVPAVLVAGRSSVPRGELAQAGIVSSYAMAALPGAGTDWSVLEAKELRRGLEDLGGRVARSWSR